MLTPFVAPLLAAFLTLSAPLTHAAPSDTLDKEALKVAVHERVATILASNGKRDMVKNFATSDISIKQTQKVEIVKGMSLFAVKLALKNPERPDAAMQDEMTLLVDASGTIQFGGVHNIATGEDMGLGKARDVTRLELPPDMSTLLAKGTGTHSVVFISDPFCPYCRTAYGHLMDRLGSIAELRIIHLPLPIHPGADMASWVMSHALSNARQLSINPLEVVAFAYSKLNAPQTQDIEAAQRSVLAQMVAAFPGLAGGMGNDELFHTLKNTLAPTQERHQQALARLRITGTPAIVVDGQPVMGFNAPEIDRLLGVKK